MNSKHRAKKAKSRSNAPDRKTSDSDIPKTYLEAVWRILRRILHSKYRWHFIIVFFVLVILLGPQTKWGQDFLGICSRADQDMPRFPSRPSIDRVPLGRILVSRYEVTNYDFMLFVLANKEWRQGNIKEGLHDGDYLKHWVSWREFPPSRSDHPVTHVSWYAAEAFCEWVGGRLPTVDEWRLAAHAEEVFYPWGRDVASEDKLCMLNFCDRSSKSDRKNWEYDDGYVETAPVDSFDAGKSPEGIYNLSGNVWEWCADVSGGRSATMGGSYLSTELECGTRTSLMIESRLCAADGGFRVCWDTNEKERGK